MTIAEKIEFFLWEEWRQEIEWNSVSDEFRRTSVYEFDAYEREILVTSLWRADLACYSVTSLQGMLLNLVLRYIDIVW